MLQSTTCNDVSKIANGRAQYNGLLYPTRQVAKILLRVRCNSLALARAEA